MERTSEVIESPPQSLVSWSSSGGETEPHRWSESQIHARHVPGWGLTPVKHSDMGTELILREQGLPDCDNTDTQLFHVAKVVSGLHFTFWT